MYYAYDLLKDKVIYKTIEEETWYRYLEGIIMDEEEINEAEIEALLINWYYYQKE